MALSSLMMVLTDCEISASVSVLLNQGYSHSG